ncbi:hypothetical protein ACFWA4_35235 [Streptomyces sp. NPDC060011]|uniref:hypothetical protein n=1 Tax=unclassified Streptomyces TaxID=2593676 RepID=UPI002259CDDE|nr:MULTISPECIES: hypothetical protein [unclassified Streptomyces]MCX5135066.1 hypothetical protein [Streptomyces sp. NBC_00340]MCX5280821.1 hypothetical protein [Streptomyces sp. NBC_00198]WSD75999.1 hypothetical protein OHB33_06605 [Streptomyces sp. NBC_01558]WSK59437.1 hypothetical protein OG458_05760 [Streptomyces sp. NBC_01281]
MTSQAADSRQEWVVLASFGSRHGAEYMLACLGRGFRRMARRGAVTAVVVGGNADGSLRLTQARVLTANGLVSALLRVCFSWTVGFMGLFSTVKGAKVGVHAAGVRQSHVDSDTSEGHRILAEAGPDAVVTLIRGADAETRQAVAAAAADRATRSWEGPLSEFLGALDPGPVHDWVRAAVAHPAK